MVVDVDIVKNLNCYGNKDIIIYGAGVQGSECLDFLKLCGFNVIGFCDSNHMKWGTEWNGLHVYSYNKLVDLNENFLVVVASLHFEDIIQLIESIDNRINICTFLSFKIAAFLSKNKFEDERVRLSLKSSIEKEKKISEYVEKEDVLCNLLSLSKDTVLVYQPGKTGSTSLTDSIRKAGKKALHIHYLYLIDQYYKNSDFLVKYRKSVLEEMACKIIVPIREPIAREISSYFQWISTPSRIGIQNVESLSEGFQKLYQDSYLNENSNLNSISQDIYCYLLDSSKYGLMFDWFCFELNRLLGCDVYDLEFDVEAGYSIYEVNNKSVMILQMEKMNELENVIGDFLGIEKFELSQNNTGEKKQYKFLYDDFKKNIRFSNEYIDFYYRDNKCFEHFYSKEQMKKWEKKWKK